MIHPCQSARIPLPGGKEFHFLFRIKPVMSQYHLPYDVKRIPKNAHRDGFSLEILDRFELRSDDEHIGRCRQVAGNEPDRQSLNGRARSNGNNGVVIKISREQC